jgi:di/tripeptidase
MTASNVICIGEHGADVDSSCYIGNIWQQTGGSQAVYVNASGKLGAQVSSRRFKDEIKPMEKASEAIYGLKPVSFRYKREIEPARPVSFGLIAEDVEQVNPDLVARDREGNPYSVRYDQVNAMLLNEFLKEHRKVEAQEQKIRQQESSIARLRDQFEALDAEQQKKIQLLMEQLKQQAAQIQQVGAKLEMRDSMPASEVVVNRP